MLLKTRNDTAALIDSLGKTELQYIDIQKQAAVEQALARWPLLTKLRQEWAEAARQGTA
ncbi:MAG: hypothetical protein E6Q40_07040 [Cupriavidus sp.]|nr:MAG: hypothetical protein E6Q40_07040 [Cupriavidus sp.]